MAPVGWPSVMIFILPGSSVAIDETTHFGHDKQYKKAHLGTALRANPFGGASHEKGIVFEKVGVEAK